MISTLVIIAYQDLRFYAVSWVAFPFLASLFFINGCLHIGLQELLLNASVNILLVGCQLILISIYFSMKQKKLVNIINTKIGLGDILIILAFCFAFAPITFILFLTASLIISFLVVLVRKRKFYGHNKIPLAAYLSISYMAFISFQLLSGFDAYNYQFLTLPNY